ncbi:MAG: PTS sugar transporter subunit IIB [Clostridiales Family XIII bacterium]|jgi:PTS system galactitol-specific IIB component|nr:PTS sugar transporter subunit IIB [Clostridiales Family XIII bacterium]
MRIKKIVVACGSGVATSQTVASKIEAMFEKEGIHIKVEAIDMKGLDTTLKNADIFISITPNFDAPADIPMFNGIPFLTGIGIEQEFEKLKAAVQA